MTGTNEYQALEALPNGLNDNFLLEEGFDLIAGFRAIKSRQTRFDIIRLIASIVAAQEELKEDSDKRL